MLNFEMVLKIDIDHALLKDASDVVHLLDKGLKTNG